MNIYLKFCAVVILCVSINTKQVNAITIDNGLENRGCNVNDARLEEENYYCPHNCSCKDNMQVKCAHAKLTEVPHDLPKRAMIIDLSFNHIRELCSVDFSNSVNAIEIILNGNKLKKLEKDVFAGLPCLERLLLAHNKLTSLAPDVFSLAVNLKLLDLSGNSIIFPLSGPFLIQPNLLYLYCNKCNWTGAYNATFNNLSKLTTLELGEYNLETKINTQVFLPLQNLTTLKLAKFEPNGTAELCYLLVSLDTISFPRFDFSCSELCIIKSAAASISTKNPNKRYEIEWLETVEDANANETIISVVRPTSDINCIDVEKPSGSVYIYIILAFTIVCFITLIFTRLWLENLITNGNQLLEWLRT